MNLRLAVTHLAALSLLLPPLTGGCSGKTAAKTMAWKTLEPGLSSPSSSPQGSILAQAPRSSRPTRRSQALHRHTAADAHPRAKTPRQWVQEASLVAAINAAMYQADHITSVSLMKSGAVINNPRVPRTRAFSSIRSTVRCRHFKSSIGDHQDFGNVASQVLSLVQSIRMLSLDGQNVWEQQLHNRWSIAAVGIDKRGRILFIHSRSPNTVHDLIDMLLTLPLT
ncbi:MAG: phosphodiester glycosidase family protein [Acidobacteriota bacterium]